MKKGKLHLLQTITATVLAIVAALLLVAEPVFAWYSKLIRYSRTEEMEIGMPPVIYLKDDNLREMTSFHLDGLKIGVEYNFVFCVSPTVMGSITNFFLGLIFTENMGMDINIYPVFKVTTDGAVSANYKQSEFVDGKVTTTCYYNFYKANDTVFEETVLNGYTYTTTYGNWTTETLPDPGESLNNGVYKSYKGLKFSPSSGESPTELIDRLNDRSRFRFFVLNITWKPDTGVENIKEADIVYIVSQGMS